VLGGAIYTKARDYFQEAPSAFHAVDGTAWEAMTGALLGKVFQAFWVRVGPLNILPSGITFTSMFDTIANLIVNRNLTGRLLALGDDMNYWGKENLNRIYSEEDPTDTRTGYILGTASGPVVKGGRQYVNQPRLEGLRPMLDRKGKMISIRMPFPGGFTPFERRRPYDPRIVATYWGLYKGWFGERTLLESLEGIQPGEFISPGEEIELMGKKG